MTLKEATPVKVKMEELTAEKAQIIYNNYWPWHNATYIMKEFFPTDPYFYKCFDLVMVEMKKLENDITVIMSDVENQPETEAGLVALISSELLDMSVIVADVIKYSNGNPDQVPPLTYDEYKVTFTNNDLI